MTTNDNESKPIRLKFSKSFLFFPTWAEITEGDVSTIKCTKDNAEGEWVTVPTNSGLHTNFGQCAISFSVDNVGDGSRPVVVGFVPRTFTAFDQKLTTGGGTGLSSTGKFYNNGVKIDASTLKFASGDRVTLKFDFTRSQTTVVVENKKTKKSTETTFKTAFPQGWIVPSVSVSGNYTAVSVDLLLDATPLDVFAARIGNETDEFDSDAFGSFYYRLYRKMNDNDVVKVGKDFYTKADIKCRTILAAPGNTPWGRGPLPGLLDVDSTTKQVTTAISDLFFVSMTDATFTRKLFEMTKGITTDNSKFLRRVGGSNAQMLRAMHAFGEIDKESNPSPVSTSATSSPNGTGSAAMLQQLMDRVAALESAQRSSTPTEDKDLKRAASRVAPKTVASSAALIARKPSVKPGGKRVIPRAAPEKKIVTTKPVSTSFSTSNALLASLQKVRKTMHDLRTMGEKGSPTDEDLKQMANLRERIAKEKMQAAKDISTMTITQAMSEEARSDVVALLTEVVAEGDQWPGNVEILQSVMKKVPIDFAPIVKDLELAATAAYDGSISFLRLLLSVPNLELDLVELVQSALFNQTRRIPVTNLLIDMAGSLGLATVAEDIADVWQEFFDDICSNDRALAREVRDGRLELIAKMLKFKTPPVTAMFEGPDGQTAFTRAAREGDIDLMTVLLTTIPGVVDINRVSKTDKTTALIQAVYKNQVTVVRALSSLPGIDVNHACPEGTALSIARTLRRHPDIIRALEAVSK